MMYISPDLSLLVEYLAMSFGVGVVTGIVLSFELGLGFARFAQVAGPAIGPMILRS
jgi:cytochrome bd-type quinol oxidase subunit 1